MTDIPEGFDPHMRKSAVTAPWEPLYAQITPAAHILALRIAPAHCNGRGMLHGGVIAALADNAMGLSIAMQSDPPTAPITINLNLDYFGQGSQGAWVEFVTNFTKVGGSVAFANALISADGTPIAKASATFRIVTR